MKFKFLFVSIMLFFVCNVVFAEKSVWYINDNTHTSKQFNEKYVDILQSLMDKGFGINNVNVNNYSKSDMNTSQCLELFDRVYKYSKYKHNCYYKTSFNNNLIFFRPSNLAPFSSYASEICNNFLFCFS